MKTISLIGSTGSIGIQTLDVCRMHNIKVKGLAANNNAKLLAKQAIEFSAEIVCIHNDEHYTELKEYLLGTNIKILCGTDGLCELASLNGLDLFVNAVVGMVGLLPTLTAIENSIDVALANKETLVAGGKLVMQLAKEHNVKIYPIDSEHSAIFQCLQGNNPKQANKIILTASGGPFFGKIKNELADVTIEQALNHPNWSMGKKITIDSATMMNKGLEFIEARWLFDIPPEKIEIIINRESVLHSAVEFDDYSVIGQLGVPDMKIPIQYSILYPERVKCDVKRLSLTDYGTLNFFKPDYNTFDCLTACINAVKKGNSYPCIVNSVNEEAVKLFLEGKISFLRIGELAIKSLELPVTDIKCYADVLKADAIAREYVLNNTLEA